MLHHSQPGSLHLLVYVCLFITFFQNPSSAEDPILTDCPATAANFTSGCRFESNLKNLLLPSLISNGSLRGFFNTSSGANRNTVYGMVQCRGDLSMEDCFSCLNSSSVGIIQECPNKKDATVRYENCLLRYSNVNFFAKADDTRRVFQWSRKNASDQAGFNQLLGDLMYNLSTSAISKPSKFDTGSIRFKDFGNIYGLVQCTQDLSGTDCSRCLQSMIRRIDECCSGKIRGQVVSKSCAIEFEDRPFVRLLSPPPPPPPPSPPPPSPPSLPPPSPSPSTIVGIIIVGLVIAGPAVMLLLCICCLINRRRRRKNSKARLIGNVGGNDIRGVESLQHDAESLQYDLVRIKDATNDFSEANKLGEGGFGAVYKGELVDGKEIAVKRLSSNSGQGTQEFKNEVVLLHKLQHRNLVRLLGFCLEGEEKILIYEYVPNRSLDKYLFDPSRKAYLDWQTRYKIIGGIARGLLYLHEDSRLRIIHRDLKAGNILLDEEMNAKIADFGMAKLFVVDQTQGNTSRIAGTFGYMAPEYAMHGLFSVKSDVFSFGVLLLEIVSGQKITSFYQSATGQDLLSYAWKHWRDSTALELMDPTLNDTFSRNEVMRCIHIALLCVQENIEDRPTMSSIVLMLNSYSVTLAAPSQPAFFAGSRTALRGTREQDFEISTSSSRSYSSSGFPSATNTNPR